MIRGETFPYVPLEDEQSEHVTVLCGGATPPELDHMRGFLANSGLPTLPDRMYRIFLMTIGRGCADALGIEGPDTQRDLMLRDLNRGILFYAGTVNEAGGDVPLPYNATTLRTVNDIHRKNFAVNSLEALNALPSFLTLIRRFEPAFPRSSNYNGFSVALLGAGMMHIITQLSIEATQDEDVDLVTEAEQPDPFRLLAAEIEYARDNKDLKKLFDEAFPVGAQTVTSEETRRSFDLVDRPDPMPYLGEVDKRRFKE